MGMPAEGERTGTAPAGQLLEAFQDSAPFGLASFDRELRFVRVNSALAAIDQIPVEAHAGRTPGELYGEPWASRIRPLLRQVLDSGETLTGIKLEGAEGPDGREPGWRLTFYPIRDAAGEILGVGVFVIDVSGELQAARMAEESERRYRSLNDTVPVMVIDASRGDGQWHFNKSWFDYTGLAPEESAAGAWMGTIHPEDLRVFPSAETAADFAEHGWEAEFRLRRGDGEYRWHAGRGTVTKGEDGTIQGWVGTAFEIHDRKLAEEGREAANRRYQALTDALPAIIVGTDISGTPTFINQRWTEYTGIGLEETIAGGWRQAVHPEDRGVLIPAVEREPEGPAYAEFRLRRGDGVYRWHLVQRIAERDSSGEPVAWIGAAIDIHDRKVAEEALREHERAIAARLDALPVLVAVHTGDGSRVTYNRSWVEYTGRSLDELLKGAPSDHYHPEDVPLLGQMVDREPGGEVEVEVRIRRHDGMYRWHLIRSVPISDGSGEPELYISSATDIHDSKMAEELVAASEQRYRTLAEAMPGMVHAILPNGHVEYINGRTAEYTGLTMQALMAAHFSVVLHPEDLERAQPLGIRARSAGEPFEFEARFLRYDGEYRWHLVREVPSRDEEGTIIRWLGTATDIHDRKVAEEEREQLVAQLRMERARLATVFQQLPAGVMISESPTGRVVLANERVEEIWGQPLRQGQDAAERAMWEGYHADGKPYADNEWPLVRAVQRGEFVRAEVAEIVRGDGSRGVITMNAAPIVDDDGQRTGGIVTFSDITEREQAVRALSLSEERYRTLVEATPAKIMLLDQDGRALFHNRAWLQYTGAKAEELHGLGWLDWLAVDDRRPLGRTWRQSVRGAGLMEVECRLRSSEGEYRWHLSRTVPISRNEDGSSLWLAAAVDIEETKQAQTALERANVLKDEFLGLVSHELRTPLTSILGHAQVLMRHHDELDAEATASSLQDIYGEAERLHRLVENMLVLSGIEGRSELLIEPILVQRLVPRVIEQHHRRFPSHEVVLSLPPDLEPIAAEQTYFEQVLGNLLSNSGKYGGASQPIEVTGSQNDDEVEIRVLDRGGGIDDEDLEHLFEPFYRASRTSRTTPGAGLGLAVCRRLIEAQGGRIWAKPREGGGSEFGFALPVER